MRRPIWTILVCSFALQLIAAAPAHAWWEYIEGLSGPKLNGPHFDGRIYCHMERRSDDDLRLLEHYRPKDKTDPIQLIPTTLGGGVSLPCLRKSERGHGYRKLWSFDLGFRYHWDKRFAPANGHKVKFMTLTPMFTWYPEPRPTRDIVDLSGGVGVYRFSSDAFTPFYGYFYDLRADVHVPTVIRRLSKWTVLIPAGRVGLLTFPGGFDQNAFAHTEAGFRSKAMDDYEKVAYVGFFFDLDALVK